MISKFLSCWGPIVHLTGGRTRLPSENDHRVMRRLIAGIHITEGIAYLSMLKGAQNGTSAGRRMPKAEYLKLSKKPRRGTTNRAAQDHLCIEIGLMTITCEAKIPFRKRLQGCKLFPDGDTERTGKAGGSFGWDCIQRNQRFYPGRRGDSQEGSRCNQDA